MAKKIQLQDANGNVLHPLTLGECVAMDNGENLDTLMSKSQMFTPTITQDKSMFKVGTGTDVDYSVNVKDGAYESLVFKGKSLINIVNYSNGDITSGNSVDLTTGTITLKGRDGWSNAFLKYQQMKPSTKYLCWVNILQVTGTVEYLQVISSSNQASAFTNAWRVESPSVGFYKNIMTSETDLTDRKYVFRSYVGSGSNGATIQYQVGCVEYQEGMENWDIPCFTGIGSVKMPILRNVGKNLFDINNPTWTNSNAVGSIVNNKIEFVGSISKYNEPYRYQIKLPSNKTYTFSYQTFGNLPKNSYPNDSCLRIMSGETVTRTIWGGVANTTFTLSNVEDGVRFDVRINKVWSEGETYSANGGMENIQLEEVTSTTSYEPYKTNILRTSEEIVLREVGGVCDTYNPLTGEYTKRIGEFILNGSDNETWGSHEVKGDNVKFAYYPTFVAQGTYQFVECLCDKWKADSQANETIQEQISLYNHMPNGTPQTEVRITVSPTRLQSVDVTGFRAWLSQNPLTVQYILAEPVTTIVKPSTMTPFAYQNGHVIVESGFEGQSLLPEIEYSVVTGRTGQVTQNTKVLRQQEQQIIGLEELLLTQVVQMEYERTLLQFDYELQMMMLG